MTNASRPRASVIVPAFNLAGYLPAALDSALAQEPPGGRVEVIVIDDGSTDDTPAVLARYGDRIRLVRQPNAGLAAAVSRGLELAQGEFLALLDADDEWPPDRLARHVRALEASPALGQVHGDMELIDADGGLLHGSFFEREQVTVHNGRVLGKLLGGNFVAGGGSTFRASMLAAILPMPPEAVYADWRMSTSIAAVAEIGVAPGIANRYRQHGANMGLGATKAQEARIQRREIEWRRWMLLNLLDDPTVVAEDLPEILFRYHGGLKVAASGDPVGARALLDVDREAAAAELAESPRAGYLRSKQLLRALARDPYDGATLVDLRVALTHDARLPPAPVPPPISTLQARDRVTLAWLDEVLETPALLRAFAEETRADGQASLVILQPAGADISGLVELVQADPLLSDERFDATVIAAPATQPARAWLAARAESRLTLAGQGTQRGRSREWQQEYASLPLDPAVERA